MANYGKHHIAVRLLLLKQYLEANAGKDRIVTRGELEDMLEEHIAIETDTGTVRLTNVSRADFMAESGTGTIPLKNVVATGSFYVESDTGDVTGTLLSKKVFITETSTGRISVPKTTSGGKCEITTSTGDIKIDIQ